MAKADRDIATAQKRTRFLEELRVRGTVYHAAKAAGIDRMTAYRWRHASPEFAEAWDGCIEDTTEVLEDSLYQRALKDDTTAAIFLLKARRPEVYRERQEIRHGGTLSITEIETVMPAESSA